MLDKTGVLGRDSSSMEKAVVESYNRHVGVKQAELAYLNKIYGFWEAFRILYDSPDIRKEAVAMTAVNTWFSKFHKDPMRITAETVSYYAEEAKSHSRSNIFLEPRGDACASGAGSPSASGASEGYSGDAKASSSSSSSSSSSTSSTPGGPASSGAASSPAYSGAPGDDSSAGDAEPEPMRRQAPYVNPASRAFQPKFGSGTPIYNAAGAIFPRPSGY